MYQEPPLIRIAAALEAIVAELEGLCLTCGTIADALSAPQASTDKKEM